jgi:two-component system, cell cycle sensor histidine kinase and response regulator CckA
MMHRASALRHRAGWAALAGALALLLLAGLAVAQRPTAWPATWLLGALLAALSGLAALAGAAGALALRATRPGTLAEAVGRTAGSSSLVGMGRATLDGRIVDCNEAMAHLFGAGSARELVNTDVRELYRDPQQREAVVGEVLRHGQASGVELRAKGRDGLERTLLLDVIANGEGLTTLAVDATEREQAAADRGRLEHQLQEAQRREEMGRLARAVAHDFNNLLTIIVGYAGAFRDELAEDDPRREAATGILQAANRAAGLARSLLAYGRSQVKQRLTADLREVVRTVEALLRTGAETGAGAGVELRVELPASALSVVADPGLLEQALVDLCASAREAMPGGGCLHLAADVVELDAAAAQARKLPGAGACARLRVRDTGRRGGPPEPTGDAGQARPAEPPRTGDGPGLSMAFGIVRQHGGHVELASDPEAGTTVTLLFPLSEGEPAPR